MPAQPTPITVQDGFAEYNWTSDMFINNTTGHSLFLYGVNSVAVIHDGKNKTSTMSLSGGPTSETDFSPFGFPANSISLQVSVNLTGNLTYDLHPIKRCRGYQRASSQLQNCSKQYFSKRFKFNQRV